MRAVETVALPAVGGEAACGGGAAMVHAAGSGAACGSGAAMPSEKQILERLQILRNEIEALRALDFERRLNRDSQISWSDGTQHEARLARIEAIRQEIAGLMRKNKL